MALEPQLLQGLQAPAPPDILGQYQKMQALKTQQLQQQDIASQVQERQATAAAQQLSLQQTTQTAKLLQDHFSRGGDPDDPQLQAQLYGISPAIGEAYAKHRNELKTGQTTREKAKAETAAAQATTAKTQAETERGPAPTGGLIWDQIQKKWIPQPTTPTQEAEIAAKTAETRKANAEAVVKELEAGTFPQTVDEATKRLNAIAPNDKVYGSTNQRFAGLLNTQTTPAQWSDTLKQAAKEAESISVAKNTVPFKVEVQQAGAAGATGDALELMGEQALNGTFTSRNPVLLTKAYQKAAELAKQRGLSAQAVVMGQRAAKAASDALNTLTTQNAQVEAFSGTAQKNMKMLQQTVDAIGGSSPLLNQPLRSLSGKVAGDPKISAFYAALLPAQTDIAKILNSTNATGVLTNEARGEMQKALGPDATPAMIRAALDVFSKDMQNRKEEYAAQLEDLKRQSVVGGPPPNQSGWAAPEGTVIRNAAGDTMIKRNGQWQKQ